MPHLKVSYCYCVKSLVDFVCIFSVEILSLCDSYSLQRREFYFDRSPRIFENILGLYRKGELHLTERVCPRDFLGELEYWGLSALHLGNYNNYSNHIPFYSNGKIVHKFCCIRIFFGVDHFYAASCWKLNLTRRTFFRVKLVFEYGFEISWSLCPLDTWTSSLFLYLLILPLTSSYLFLLLSSFGMVWFGGGLSFDIGD